ncbi:unnamed protein product [Parajaminaea phylloscopi]
MSSSMQRSVSSSSQRRVYEPPPGPRLPPGEMGTVAIDSSNPTIGDFLYRLDDQQQQEAWNEAAQPGPAPPSPPPPAQDAGSSAVDDHLQWAQSRPWWRRPSPYWLLPLATLLAVAGGSIASTKVELFTQIVCEEKIGMEPSAGMFRFPHERPPMAAICRSDEVIAGSADLQMKITIVMGLLSVLTTGWWAGLSDRRGRTTVLCCAVSGLLTGDLSLLAVGLLPVAKLPFGTHFMLISSAIEGMLGGIATMIAAHQAYISDSTPAGTRARVYAQMTGFFFVGYVVGPALGGYMARATDSLMSTVVFATTGHLLYLLLLVVAVPESVSSDRKREAMAAYEAKVRSKPSPDAGEQERGQASDNDAGNPRSTTRLQWLTRRALIPLRPMLMLLPRDVDEVERLQSRPATPMPSISQLRLAGSVPPATDPAASSSHISVSHISRRRKRDWNLFWLSCSYALSMSCMGLMTTKALYAQEFFGWGAGQLGLYLTTVSIARVIALTCVLPVVIKVWHRPPKSVALPQDSNERLAGETVSLLNDDGRLGRRSSGAAHVSYGTTTAHATKPNKAGERADSSPDLVTREVFTKPVDGGDGHEDFDDDEDDPSQGLFASEHHASVEELWTLRARHLRMIHDSHFDLKLTRISFLCDAFCYLLLCFIPGPVVFVGASALLAVGAGGSASMSSLALAFLHRPTEAGNLFGAWSILSALGSTVVGPLFFTWVFRTGPHNIFYAGEAVLLAAFACTLMIRVRKPRSLPGLPPRPPSMVSPTSRP